MLGFLLHKKIVTAQYNQHKEQLQVKVYMVQINDLLVIQEITFI